MKIGGSEKKPELSSEAIQSQRQKARQIAEELTKRTVSTDSVDLKISDASQLLIQPIEAESVEARSKRVAALKASVAAGTYLQAVDMREVAKKMIVEFSSISSGKVEQNVNEES